MGAGFGGLACAASLGRRAVQVTVIDQHNYHLFVPLLYQVATAALSPADIARPIRRILSKYKNIEVLLGEVIGVDRKLRRVQLADGSFLAYDRLVIATGSEYSYFGHPEWAQFAPGPRSIEQAREIRNDLLLSFERAEATDDPARRDALMTTIIVGGGPTGVEMAGSVAELARHALVRDFRHIDPRTARVILIEAGPRILSGFPVSLSNYAHAALERLGVTVWTDRKVERVDRDGVVVAGRRIPAGCVIWGAGIQASPAARWLGIPPDRAGRIPVGPDLAVCGAKDIYCIGDTSLVSGADGRPLAALAQVAKQEGQHLGRALAANLERGVPIPPFRFRNRGDTAIVGRHAAVFDFGWLRLRGRIAWMLWAIIHIYLLIGFQNRILVGLQWAWRYVTYERGARLVTSEHPHARCGGAGVSAPLPTEHAEPAEKT
ncbi:MAG TPA: NAD(P)/FAD-dependent oxidoreductase [Xanthobacteraceae bacterium]|nr:NAD(P)/FAD-dependent oxidoreductase [Xanthobacteraceae bacterium]